MLTILAAAAAFSVWLSALRMHGGEKRGRKSRGVEAGQHFNDYSGHVSTTIDMYDGGRKNT
jgi:hypothetical protein